MCKNEGRQVQKVTPSPNNTSSYERVSSSILFLMNFCPKIMYDMIKMEQGCTRYKHNKKRADLDEFAIKSTKKRRKTSL